MVEIKLDESDKAILNGLQKDCKQSMRKLSKQINVPITTLHRRIKRLEKLGVITGYHARVDSKKVGKDVTAFMVLALNRKADVQAVGEKLGKMEGVQEVHYTAGEWDMILKVKMPDLDSYYKFSAEGTIQFEEIDHGIGIIVPRTFKEESIIEI